MNYRYNRDESHKHKIEQKQQDIKRISYEPTYIKYKNRQNYPLLSEIKIAVIVGDVRRGSNGESITGGVFWGTENVLFLDLDYGYMFYTAIKKVLLSSYPQYMYIFIHVLLC